MGKAEWMSGNYGIMVHYLSSSMPKTGEKHDLNYMADHFDVKRFVNQVKDMGAKWVIFPFGQNTGYYWSYNAAFEKYLPDRFSRRDLILELAVELKRQGLKFIAYLPTEVDVNVPEVREAFGWDLSADKKVFMERWTEVVQYYAEKFGELMDGWWLDGNYKSSEKDFMRTHDWDNSRFHEEHWFEALRAGNAQRITAMCNGANHMSYVFEQEEYLPGEVGTLDKFPWVYGERQKQWHALIWLDCFWGHCERVGKIDPPRFSDRELSEYAERCLGARGAITWNIGIYEDGSLAEDTVAQLHRVFSMKK